MKTYWRILTYAGPIQLFIFFYLLATMLATVLSLASVTLLIPLLKVLFNQAALSDIVDNMNKPSFALNLTYVKDLFNYYFAGVIVTQGRLSALYLVCSIMVVTSFFNNLFRYLSEVIVAQLSANTVCQIRRNVFDKVTQLPIRYFTEQNRGDVIARVINDVQEVEHALAQVFKTFFKEPVTIVSFFIVLFQISSRLTLLALFALPIVSGVVTAIIRRLLKKALYGQALLGKLVGIVEEIIRGIRAVHAFTAQSYMLDRFAKENQQYAQVSYIIFLRKSFVPCLSEFLGITTLALLMAYGGKLILLQEADFAASTFITYVIIFFQTLVPIKSISRSLGDVQRGLAAGKRIFALVDMPIAHETPLATRKIGTLTKDIRFRDVCFAYDKEPILRHLNMTILKGKKMAIVGLSGSGKSTIIGLLSNVYQPSRGTITVDGTPIQDFAASSLNQLISVATHDTVLFHDTVYHNITLGRPVEAATVEAVARIAHIHDFITALSNGYQTVIGGKKSQLSSGQIQRIGIARAILGQPSVLILDEATTALDSVIEQRVRASLYQFMQGKTLVIITHNLSSIRDVDEILVVDAGEVVERGTHETLMQQDGLYKRLTIAHNGTVAP